MRRSQLTARLSHLCLLIPALFYLLTLLFLHLLLFLLLPSAAEAVQATEAGTGEGHGLPDAPHPRQPAAREGGGEGGREEKRGDVRPFLLHLAICQGITPLVRKRSPVKSFEHTWISGIKEQERAFSFFHEN